MTKLCLTVVYDDVDAFSESDQETAIETSDTDYFEQLVMFEDQNGILFCYHLKSISTSYQVVSGYHEAGEVPDASEPDNEHTESLSYALPARILDQSQERIQKNMADFPDAPWNMNTGAVDIPFYERHDFNGHPSHEISAGRSFRSCGDDEMMNCIRAAVGTVGTSTELELPLGFSVLYRRMVREANEIHSQNMATRVANNCNGAMVRLQKEIDRMGGEALVRRPSM